jgi:hypothetical protein
MLLTPVMHIEELLHPGRAIAQAVSCWLPTAAAWVHFRIWSSGICGGQSGAGASFLRVLRFPPGTIGQSVAATLSGPSWTLPPH